MTAPAPAFGSAPDESARQGRRGIRALRQEARRLRVPGGEIRCLDMGHGRPVLFLHGIPDSADAWLPLIERVAAHHRCLAPDLPGFGDSPAPEGFDSSLPAMAAFVADVIAAAGIAEPLALVVHDVGGAFGLAFATTAPQRLRRLVILNTSFFSGRRWHGQARLLRVPVVGELAMALIPQRGFAAALRRASAGNLSPEQIETTFARFGPGARRMALRLYRALDPAVFRGWEDRLPGLTAQVPALVLWGERDPYLPSGFAARFGARVLRRYDACGHWPHREAPARVADDLLAFLA